LLHRCHELVLIHGLLKERDCAGLDGAGFSHLWVLSCHDDDRDATQGRIGFESLQNHQAIPAGKAQIKQDRIRMLLQSYGNCLERIGCEDGVIMIGFQTNAE